MGESHDLLQAREWQFKAKQPKRRRHEGPVCCPAPPFGRPTPRAQVMPHHRLCPHGPGVATGARGEVAGPLPFQESHQAHDQLSIHDVIRITREFDAVRILPDRVERDAPDLLGRWLMQG